MNYLAIDTSSRALTVVARKGEQVISRHMPDCALKHSVVLMDVIDEALNAASLTAEELDAVACVVGGEGVLPCGGQACGGCHRFRCRGIRC